VTSQDTSGHATVDPAASYAPATFTTPTPDTTKPSVGAPAVTVLADGTASVEWTTDKAWGSVADSGPAADKMKSEIVDPAAVTDHSMLLTGLVPKRTYFLNVTSTDASGTATASRAVRLVTVA